MQFLKGRLPEVLWLLSQYCKDCYKSDGRGRAEVSEGCFSASQKVFFKFTIFQQTNDLNTRDKLRQYISIVLSNNDFKYRPLRCNKTHCLFS